MYDTNHGLRRGQGCIAVLNRPARRLRLARVGRENEKLGFFGLDCLGINRHTWIRRYGHFLVQVSYFLYFTFFLSLSPFLEATYISKK